MIMRACTGFWTDKEGVIIQYANATIMIVDDTPANLEILEEILREKGHAVMAFPGGRMAIEAAGRIRPDLVLLDIMMPDMDGYAVCRQLKADAATRDIPVLFISALEDIRSKITALSIGGVDYVTKPFQPEEVQARVATHLRIVQLQQHLKAQNENLQDIVAQRTHALAQANERLMKLNRLKDDFFRMISHEVRTPANGLLGIGALIVQQYMEGEAADEYKDLLRQSGQRLENLLDDMALLLNLQEDEVGMEEPYPLEDALNRLRRQNPAVEIQLGNEISPQQMLLKIEPRMLDKVLTVFTRLAGYFMTGDTLSISVSHEYTGSVHMQIELDNLVLTDEQLNGFFSIDSPVRGFTPAQSMGIAPVVASSVLDVCGGSLQFTRDHDAQGRLTAIIPSSMGEQHD